MIHSCNYRSILKATSLIGGSSFINILIGMLRTKFVALLLGPAGVGLIGMFGTITGTIGSISSMGLSTSGVRQIAESYGAEDDIRIARTVITLRRTVWLTGAMGMMITVLGCVWWSKVSFGTSEHAFAIALLGLTILLEAISVGQSCILQGTRRIADIAKINVIGAITGTLISIPCFYLWGMDGIVPSLLLCGTARTITSWSFARRVAIKKIHLPWRESRAEVAQLFTFGLPIMLSGIGGALTVYVIRLILIQQFGIEGIGSYLAAFGLSGALVNFVLSAMGTDYYPRLVGVASDKKKIAVEVNTQTEIGLLLAVPGLAATLIFAPIIIEIFYSSKFDSAVGILRWLVFGVFGQIVVWPLGYVIQAMGKSKITLWAEALNDIVYISLIWFCIKQWGLSGAGIAFALLYVFATTSFLIITKAIANTTWTRSNVNLIIGTGAVLAIIAANCNFSPELWHVQYFSHYWGFANYHLSFVWLQWGINLALLILLSFYCLFRLLNKTGITKEIVRDKIYLKLNIQQ
jgi:PST family polysaccharide transporter